MLRVLALMGATLLITAALPIQRTVDPVACSTRDAWVYYLDQKYSETPQTSGLTSRGDLLEVFISEGGTWTLILTVPSGTSCVLLVGNNWNFNLEKDNVGLE